jgi:glycosyltransferase involved in cell wall biosynthesis
MSTGLYYTSGFSTVIEALADKLVESGHDVAIGALSFKRFPRKSTYRIETIPIGNVFKLRRFLENFDIIHNHHPITNYLSLISRKPFIYHYHGAPNSRRNKITRYSGIASMKITKNYIDEVIAVSETACTELKKYFSLDKIHVIYNGVDTAFFRPGLAEKYRKGTPQLLFVGNLYEYKNVEELIFATKKITNMYPKLHLQVVGYGNTYKYLKHLAVELGLENNVELTGHVAHSELPYYYASCDVYVTASRFESFSLPPLEAMACGKPVVASSIPSHDELVSSSKAGEEYELGNIQNLCVTIANVYDHKDEFRDNALRFAEEHDWSIVTDRVKRIYDKILSD